MALAPALPVPAPVDAAEAAAERSGDDRPRAPLGLVLACGLIALAIVSPLAFLAIQAAQAGWAEVSRLLFRQLTATLLWNTVSLSALVTVGCGVVGTAAAITVERTTVPLRRMWAVLVVIPLAIPDFVVGYAWVSAVPDLHGLWGAALVMTLALYPLVYLPVAASLRRTDPALEEVARSLGAGRVETFRRVTLRQIRRALLGGCLVVALALLAEFGAFEILRFQTFTTTIFEEFQVGFNSPAACALSVVLVVLGLLVLIAEAALHGGERTGRVVTATGRPPTRTALRWGVVPAFGGLAALVGLALGLPLAVIGYWLTHGHSTTLPGASMAAAAAHTAIYAALAAALATLLALPIAVMVVRYRGRLANVIERATYLVQSLPGLVIALSLVFFSVHYVFSLYQTGELLVVAYAILFFPLALICVLASVAQAPPRLPEVARSLGSGRFTAFRRVTLPLIAPGLAAGFCLVFLSAVTELTATLILIPTGAHTLATQFWAYETNASYRAAAPYAAAMVGIAVVPSYLLSHWFDRRGRTVAVASPDLEASGPPTSPPEP